MRPNESFIGQPVRSLQTMLRVLAEDDRRLPTVVPDGIYGPNTANAISALQRREGLPSTGVADQRTWEAVVKSYEPALIRIGKAQPIEIALDPGEVIRSEDSNPYILLLQSMLAHLASEHSSIEKPTFSGVLDPATMKSLSSFQYLSGLQATGELDKISWKHLVHQFSLNAEAKKHQTHRNT